MGKHAENKAEKCDRIVSAAWELMRAEGSNFSMRALAKQAEVSLATPYNLFGSKQAVIAAVMDSDLARLQRAMAAQERDPVDAFFELVEISVGMLEKAPLFYKAGAAALDERQKQELQIHFRVPRHVFLRRLVENAVQSGVLNHQINLDLFALNLGQQFLSWIQAWAKGQIALAEIEARVGYTFALTLSAAATDAYRAPLFQRALEWQKRLQQDQRSASDEKSGASYNALVQTARKQSRRSSN